MIDINKYSMGATAAIITSMGLVAGLNQGNSAKIGILTGLLVIAIADNVSDSLGIHIYKESEGASKQDIRSTTYGNFSVRLFLAFTFVAIVMVFSSHIAFVVSSIWGLVLLAILSYLIAKRRKTKPLREIAWHLAIALIVIAGSKLLGHFILKAMSRSGL